MKKNKKQRGITRITRAKKTNNTYIENLIGEVKVILSNDFDKAKFEAEFLDSLRSSSCGVIYPNYLNKQHE